MKQAAYDPFAEDKLGEECGVFGIYDFDGNSVASTIYYGLLALQHSFPGFPEILVSGIPAIPRRAAVPGKMPSLWC